jgi:hypothetical protein
MKRLLLMCDYFAWPVWEFPSRLGVGEDAVPVCDETKAALREWAATYDRRLQTGDFSAPYDEARHDDEGRALWRRVQAELGSGWHVGYFNEATGTIEWP